MIPILQVTKLRHNYNVRGLFSDLCYFLPHNGGSGALMVMWEKRISNDMETIPMATSYSSHKDAQNHRGFVNNFIQLRTQLKEVFPLLGNLPSHPRVLTPYSSCYQGSRMTKTVIANGFI